MASRKRCCWHTTGWIIAATAPGLVGCAPQWYFSYDEAVRQARHVDRDLLIFYKDPLDLESSTMRDILESPAIAGANADKVWCTLVPLYAPDRKFVGQYGVTEAPAIVVVHPDKTYHALRGVQDAAAVARFLASARAPGLVPKQNPQVPRRACFEYFNVFERARETARRQNRTLCVVFKWWLDPPSTELIRRITRPHVARYFVYTVNCILDWDYVPNRRHVARFGVRRYPAIILIEPDGRFRVLRGLRRDDEIIRFALARRAGGSARRTPSTDPVPSTRP